MQKETQASQLCIYTVVPLQGSPGQRNGEEVIRRQDCGWYLSTPHYGNNILQFYNIFSLQTFHMFLFDIHNNPVTHFSYF